MKYLSIVLLIVGISGKGLLESSNREDIGPEIALLITEYHDSAWELTYFNVLLARHAKLNTEPLWGDKNKNYHLIICTQAPVSKVSYGENYLKKTPYSDLEMPSTCELYMWQFARKNGSEVSVELAVKDDSVSHADPVYVLLFER